MCFAAWYHAAVLCLDILCIAYSLSKQGTNFLESLTEPKVAEHKGELVAALCDGVPVIECSVRHRLLRRSV